MLEVSGFFVKKSRYLPYPFLLKKRVKWIFFDTSFKIHLKMFLEDILHFVPMISLAWPSNKLLFKCHVELDHSHPLYKIVKKLQYQICAGDILLLHYYTRATSPKLHWFQILEDCAPLEFCICIISKVHLAYHANLKVSCLKVMVIRSIALLRASRPQ